MSDVEKLAEIINDFFGCDAAYFEVNPFDLATHIISNGVTLPLCCKDCEYLSERRVALVCSHPKGLKNPSYEASCCHAKPKLTT